MKTVKVNIAELKHPEKNVRIHTEKQIKELQKSIKMFGQIRPVIVDENNVILAGNGLVQALKEMGQETVDVLPMKNLSENDKKKLMIADNRIYTLGYDDNEAIFEILSSLDGDFDVPGYEEEVLQDLLASEDEVDEHIESYGKLEPEQIQEFREAGERLEERTEQSIREQQQIQEQGYQDVAETVDSIPAKFRADTNEQATSEPHHTASVKRSITCPHCGGDVWL